MMKWNCQGSVISLLLSHHNKDLKQWTLKPLACHSSRTVRVIVLRQISFIQKIRTCRPKRHEENSQRERDRGRETMSMSGRETPGPLSPLFMFFPPPGATLCKLGQPGVLFVLPEVLTQVLRPSFVLFSWAFPLLVFQPPPFWTPFSYSNYLTELYQSTYLFYF